MTYKASSMGSTTKALGIHRDSRGITKIQPKIRIIHIYAPEIIKTDVANFRELVQRLTGKPSAENGAEGKNKGKGKNKKVNCTSYDHTNVQAAGGERIVCDKSTVNTKLEFMNMGNTASSSSPSSSSDLHSQHDHQEFWRSTVGDQSNSTTGGFLSAFTDLDDNFDLSMFTMGVPHHDPSSHLTSFGESAQLSFRG